MEKGKRRGLDIPEQIPEGDEVIHDQEKARLPAFRESLAWHLSTFMQFDIKGLHCLQLVI